MGALFKVPAIAIYFVGGLWGLWICVGIVYSVGGNILAALSLVVAPFLLYLAPWYAAVAHGDWFPVLLVYGTSIVAGILFAIGSAIDGG